MVFGSIEIWLLLPLALILYFALPSKYRWTVLLVGSILYLSYFSIPFLVYATIYAVANFYFGRVLEYQTSEKARTRFYQLFIILNIGQLVVYKYLDFLIENLNLAVGSYFGEKIPYLHLIVPIGISYYTFQCIGYIINVYRKVEKAETNIAYFLIYNLFFPKILSGPIERSERFLPQLRNPAPYSDEFIKSGLKQILTGVFKKLVIAERLALIVNSVYGNIAEHSGYSLLPVMFIQALYIYSDFSGYTDIALGIARMFGINLTNNFSRPFFSTNVTNFWRKWHISLSTWCNDYIFKTIIFRKRKWGIKAAVYGVFITFFIIGLWHGPTWTYVILGILQGLAINYEFFSKKKRLEIGSKIPVFWNNLLSRFITFSFFGFSLIFFFSPSIKEASYFVTHLFYFPEIVGFENTLGLAFKDIIIVLLGIVLLFSVEIAEETGLDLHTKLLDQPVVIRWSVYYLFILIILAFGQFTTTNFIYFQF